MGIFKTIFGNVGSRVWFIVTAIMVALIIVVSILANTVFYNLFCTLWGWERRITGDGVDQIFEADFETKEDARKNGEAVNELISEEGFVLLHNKNGALPVQKGRVSVFGKNADKLVTGGSGSGGGSGDYEVSIYDSLIGAGFTYNETLKSFYESNSASGSGRSSNPQMENDGSISLKTGETPQSAYTDPIVSSYQTTDTALIVISRIGGEGWDLPRVMKDKNGALVEGARNENDHYLQLDKNETELIAAVCGYGFANVVVVLNSSSPLETGFLDDPTHYAYNANIDACLWVGAPGDTGIMALGRILSGEVNPSGRLPDTYVRDFKTDPTWQNFGNYLSSGGQDYTGIGNKISSYNYSFVDYEEGIYVGYRYWETRGHTDGEAWYNNHVVYPFGHGMSYTQFNQEIVNKSALNGMAITKNGKITVNVKVTNTGTVAGKDVVQIYVTAPYTAGEIEKSHVVLAGFAKTAEIAGGQSETVAVEIEPYDFASYDYNDANDNGFTGYELEAGSYTFTLAANAHITDTVNVFDSFAATVGASGIRYDTATEAGKAAVNRFADAADELTVVLSRADWEGTKPAPRTSAEKVLSAAANAKINSVDTNNPISVTQFPTQGAAGDITFRDLVGVGYGESEWDDLLDRLTVSEMVGLINNGAFKTEAILSIGKPKTTDADGPGGFVNFMSSSSMGEVYGCSHYACEPIVAATFNTDLAFALGEAVGNEALVGNERGDGAPYSGWYAPGVNLHRGQFGGRYFEYYSEDTYLSGMLAAYQIQGAMSKGVYTQVKHFAVNEQETSRTGVCTWLDEQTLREIYLKPFEMAVKKGGTIGMMSSFNRIGTVWTGGDYRLLTEVLREEWGFTGMVICDFNTGSHMNAKQMFYGGGDLNLQTLGQDWSPSRSNATDLTVVRNASKNILYTVSRSNVMNSEVIGYRLPQWVVYLIIADVVAGAALAVWGFFAIRGAYKKKNKTT